MMQDLLIRQVKPDDLDACFGIESRCYGPEGATRERIQIRLTQYPQGFLVAERDGRVIGFINSGVTDKDDISDEALKELRGHDPNGRNIVIFSLAVDPDYQKRGISVNLMEAFIERAAQLGKSAILLLCREELIAYYERFGFVLLGASASTHGGLAWHEMRRLLKES